MSLPWSCSFSFTLVQIHNMGVAWKKHCVMSAGTGAVPVWGLVFGVFTEVVWVNVGGYMLIGF